MHAHTQTSTKKNVSRSKKEQKIHTTSKPVVEVGWPLKETSAYFEQQRETRKRKEEQ